MTLDVEADLFTAMAEQYIAAKHRKLDDALARFLAQNADYREFLSRYYIIEIKQVDATGHTGFQVMDDNITIRQRFPVRWRRLRKVKRKVE